MLLYLTVQSEHVVWVTLEQTIEDWGVGDSWTWRVASSISFVYFLHERHDNKTKNRFVTLIVHVWGPFCDLLSHFSSWRVFISRSCWASAGCCRTLFLSWQHPFKVNNQCKLQNKCVKLEDIWEEMTTVEVMKSDRGMRTCCWWQVCTRKQVALYGHRKQNQSACKKWNTFINVWPG